jgi:hypothetical protein
MPARRAGLLLTVVVLSLLPVPVVTGPVMHLVQLAAALGRAVVAREIKSQPHGACTPQH